MVLDIGAVVKLIRDNVARTGLPIPVGREVLGEWARGLGLPGRGSILLYTGALYQLMPHIDALAKQLERMEGGRVGRIAFRAAGRLGRLAGLASLILKPPRESVEYSRGVLTGIVRLLRAAGVEVAYDPGLDGYSGVLLYDMGLDDDFRAHAEGEARKLVESGAELIVTVDPHTTHVLREVYPRLFPWFDVPVRSYLEILADNVEDLRFKPGNAGEVVVHDPCLYARGLGIVEEPRLLLERAGYKVLNPRRWGRMTYCCGGPIESVSPKLSKRIAMTRAEELADTGARTVAVMCPICLTNLRRVAPSIGLAVEDVSVLLAGRLEG